MNTIFDSHWSWVVPVRLGVFLALLVGLVWLESRWPRRPRGLNRRDRWPSALVLVATSTVLVRLLGPLVPVAVAIRADQEGWGLLPALDAPAWLAGLVAFVLLDALIYFQHRITHAVPLLWRLHRVHHTDPEIDASTALRFHPLEIAGSAVLKAALVALLGPPVLAVVLFEIALNGAALFNHSNLALSARADRILRRVLVTPDMHRVHHSVHKLETDSNFGFTVPWWDWLFGTYRAEPRDGHEAMRLGQPGWEEKRQQGILPLLAQPFRSRP